MPMGAEQGHNAHMLLSLKYGRVLNKFTVTEQQVFGEINEVIFIYTIDYIQISTELSGHYRKMWL
jgi:hypothetical protein